jgi:uncharacterized protein (DUF1778 family)
MKRARIDLRAMVSENELWDRAALKAGISKSELIRRATNQAALDIVNNHTQVFNVSNTQTANWVSVGDQALGWNQTS